MRSSETAGKIRLPVLHAALALVLAGCAPATQRGGEPRPEPSATTSADTAETSPMAASATSKAAPVTSKAAPVTSKAVPATSKAVPATSEAAPATSETAPVTAEAAPPEPAKLVRRGKSLCIALDGLFNNDAIASDGNPRDGNFDIEGAEYGDTFPWVGMPEGGEPFAPEKLQGVTFLFPDYADGKENNVACRGQQIRIPPAGGRTLYVLGASESDSQESTLTLLTGDGGQKEVSLKMTDWCQEVKYGEIPVLKWDHRIDLNGEREAISCAMFVQTIELEPEVVLHGLRLPQHPQIHIFALTLQE